MLRLFRRRLLFPVSAILFLAIGVSACKPMCLPKFTDVWAGSGYAIDYRTRESRQPVNVWIDNPQMAASLAKFIEKDGVRSLVYRHDFKCVPKPTGDRPDCLVCTLNRRGVIGVDCEPDGDLFVKAEIGPGNAVRAQTYWRR